MHPSLQETLALNVTPIFMENTVIPVFYSLSTQAGRSQPTGLTPLTPKPRSLQTRAASQCLWTTTSTSFSSFSSRWFTRSFLDVEKCKENVNGPYHTTQTKQAHVNLTKKAPLVLGFLFCCFLRQNDSGMHCLPSYLERSVLSTLILCVLPKISV